MKILMKISAIIAISVFLLVSGCSSVTTDRPLSADSKPLDKEKFEGTWLFGDDALTVRFASNGVGRLAGVEWKDDQFQLAQGEMIVTEGKKNNFLSVRFQEDGVWTNEYCFFQYSFTDQGDLLLWLPNPDVFEHAIKTNALSGVVRKEQFSTSVTVTNATGVLLDFINQPERLDLFKYKEPVVLRRIAGPKK